MNISDWSLSKKMMLPDHCFGSRQIIQLARDLSDANAVYATSDAGLAETSVIWEIAAAARGAVGSTIHIALALGDRDIPTEAQWNALEIVFPDVRSSDEGRGEFEVSNDSGLHLCRLRFPVHAAGRRIVARFIRHQGNATEGTIVITLSSLPYEVPSCLLSV